MDQNQTILSQLSTGFKKIRFSDTAQPSRKRRLSSNRREGEVSKRRCFDNFLVWPHFPRFKKIRFSDTAQPSRKRRLSSKRTKPSSHTHRCLYKSPVFSLKVNRLPSLLVNKKKPSKKGRRICVDVQSYPIFKCLLQRYETLGAAPVSFDVSNCVDRADYIQIVNDLLSSNSRSGRRDKIKNPRPSHYLEPFICSSVEVMKAIYNILGSNWKAIMRPGPEHGDCKNAKLLAEMHKFRLKVGIDIHFAAQPSRKIRSSSISKIYKGKKDYKWKKKIKKPSRKSVEVHQIRVDVSSYAEFKSLLKKYVTQKAVTVSFNVSRNVGSKSYHKIVKLLIQSNSNKVRRDKIECPRADYRSHMIVKCHTLENIKMVYNAIGGYWSAEICLPPLEDCPSDYNTLYYEMCNFLKYAGIYRLI